MSSFDFCNTTRSADSPRDSFTPRACAGRSQTRSPPCTVAGAWRRRAAPDPLRASTGRGHRVRGCSFTFSKEVRRRQSPGSTRLEHPLVTDGYVRALVCPSPRVSRRPTSTARPAKGERSVVDQDAFHRQDRSVSWRSLSMDVSTGLPLDSLARRVEGVPTPLLPTTANRP